MDQFQRHGLSLDLKKRKCFQWRSLLRKQSLSTSWDGASAPKEHAWSKTRLNPCLWKWPYVFLLAVGLMACLVFLHPCQLSVGGLLTACSLPLSPTARRGILSVQVWLSLSKSRVWGQFFINSQFWKLDFLQKFKFWQNLAWQRYPI